MDRASLKFDRTYQTANGVVRGAPVRLKRVEIGSVVVDDVRASVNEAPMGTSLLGMSFLSRLSAWRVEGDRLTLVR
jgi:aspartyl protease family protein